MMEQGAIVAVIVGVASVLKGIGLPAKWVPLLNVVIGAACGFLLEDLDIMAGIVLGLMASGLYDQTKIFKGGSL